MSLKVYFDESCVPDNLKVIRKVDSYFEGMELQDNDNVRMLLAEIDDSSYQAPKIIVSNKHKDRGGLYNSYLSTACKAGLLISEVSESKGWCISPLEVSTDAWNVILRLRTGNVIFKYTSIMLPDDTECDILFNDKHLCRTIGEFINKVEEYEDSL